MSQAPQFPAPDPTDPEDVAWTLQTAGAMWSRGDNHEAVRWLRRAAEAAGDCGHDLRAVALARAAADLTAALQLPPSIPPPPAAAAAAPAAAQSAPSADRPRPPPVSRPRHPGITPVDDADGPWDSEYTIPDLGAADPRRDAPARSSPRAAPPPPSSRSSPSGAPPPARSSPSGAPPPARSSSSAAPPSRSSPGASATMAFRPRQALRVAVVPSPDDKSLLLVRPLADDEAVPDGAHEAILTALEPGAHLLSKKR